MTTYTDAIVFYNNGTLQKIDNSSSISLSSNLTSGSAGWWNGSLDEVMHWDRALTDDEASALWNGGLGRIYST